MEKTALLENLAAAKRLAMQSKANADGQKTVIAALVALGKNPTGAERILQRLEQIQTDDLTAMERILNELDDSPT